MTKKIYMILLILFLLFSFVFNVLGLMKLLPIYLTSPFYFWHFFLSFFTLIIEIVLKDFKKLAKSMTSFILVCYSNCSSSVNFSSNTLRASSIGFLLVISTPAFLRTSIG